ncbi:ADP-ribose 1''-phosphate phosphatase [Aspergillus chevalieri]|uniref:ADP-ribose 1''-phosphate phosphatase n=1 Tax=Aspergillus chevalieri TaxID=182096 RepID=A0A7R7ZMT0_ASPCH|nr:ADP-ribose 1''-phosphate phosphatase [Aspergillus chevalieri]BCR86796.1 ADP-ribose 1''-phosphate phosphatase [Aspergillus chevalieri]
MSTITEIEDACNCQGSWGAGIAEAFRDRYPAAYSIYRSHCLKYSRRKPQYKTVESTDPKGKPVKFLLPTGTALLIPPQEEDYKAQDDEKERQDGRKHWIICLFTSHGYGKRLSRPATILAYTEFAVADLREQLQGRGERSEREGEGNIEPPSELWSCRFNSGLFDVEWGRSRHVLEEAGLEVTVVRPPGEEL